MNNAVYWQAVEHVLPTTGIDPRAPLVVELDYREPIDLDDRLELATADVAGKLLVGFRADGGARAVARLAGR